MPLVKHPTNGRISDVNKARATVLRARGYTDVAPEEQADALQSMSTVAGAPSAVQPQPPIDTRDDPPEPPVDARPDDLIGEPPIDTRPPNPLGETADSVQDADGAGLDQDDKADDEGPPAKSAPKADWVAYAQAQSVEDADQLTKDELIDRVGS